MNNVVHDIEAAILGVVGVALVVLAVRAIVLRRCRPPTAISLGVAGLFAALWALGGLAPQAPDFVVPLQAYEVLFFGIVGLTVFLYAAEISREQARRLERSLADQQQKRTALDEKDRLYRALLQSSPVALFAVQPDATVRLAEGQAITSLGFDARQAVGRDAFELIGRHKPARAALIHALRGEPQRHQVEFGGRFFDVTLTPLREGDAFHVLGVALDVTEERRREAAERQRLEQDLEIRRLREMDAFKTQLLNTASHELNTPITPLLLQLHVLKSAMEASQDGRQRRAVEVLDRNVRRLATLVKDVLDVARLQSGVLKVERSDLRVADSVQEALDTYALQAREKGVALRGEVPANLHVLADAARVGQILSNLLANALRFTPAGGRIDVTAQLQGSRAYIEVRDSGAGLTADQMHRLFQPFSQVHDTKKHDVGGTGLGLYITKGIIEQMGGQIGCDSDGPGHGTVFWFTLPAITATVAHP